MRQVIPRRQFLALTGAFWAVAGGARAEEYGPDHPAVKFVKKGTTALFTAHKQGTVQAFLPVIEDIADVPYIADYALGQYLPKLPKGMEDAYHRGVALFMARYFAEQTRSYRVAKWEVGRAYKGSGDTVQVSTRVTLLSGQAYVVGWVVAPRGDGWKFVDAKVMIFSLTYAQRGLFVSWLQKHNGDVTQLITVLNRK